MVMGTPEAFQKFHDCRYGPKKNVTSTMRQSLSDKRFSCRTRHLLSQSHPGAHCIPFPSIQTTHTKIPRPAVASDPPFHSISTFQPCPTPAAPAPSTPSRYRTTRRRTVSQFGCSLLILCVVCGLLPSNAFQKV